MKRSLLVALAVFPMAVPLSCRAAPSAKRVQSQVAQYMEAAVKVDDFMGSVLVARDGKILVAKGYGMANLKKHVPNTADTEFRIGSITKQFTATAILMLQAEGKLNVHDRICQYVPKCPGDWRPITIYDLLTHTSGIPNFTSFPNYEKFQTRQVTPAQLLADFENKPLDFKPGTKFSYSNSGYAVLGYIVQRVSGETYRRFLQRHIFGPLGMKDSGYDSSHPTANNHAMGYQYSRGGEHPAQFVNMSVPYSAGALYSTVRDLYTWDRALAAGTLLPAVLQKQMFAQQVPVGGQLGGIVGGSNKAYYGFGWFVSKEFGHEEYSHEGGIQGFTSLNSWFPGQHAYVIVLDNVTSPRVFVIARSLAAILFGDKYTIPAVPTAIHLPAKELEKFVGTYQLTPRFAISVMLKGDRLVTQGTGQPTFPIEPDSKTEFFSPRLRGMRLDFVVGADGRVSGLVLHQNGATVHGKKLEPGEKIQQPATPKTVPLSPEALQKFVGTYRLAPDFSITITRDGDQLKEQATGQPAEPIFPESKDEFFLKVVDAQIRFVTDAEGKVTGLVLHQHGRNIPGEKIR